MRKIFGLLLSAGLFYSCTTSTDSSTAEADAAVRARADANLELVASFVDAFKTGEVEKWWDLCSEDFVTYGPGFDDESTLEEYIEIMSGFYDAIDSMRSETTVITPFSIDEGDLAGDYVLWWGTNSAYYIEAGKSVSIRLHTVYKIEEGRITWNSDYWDTGDLQRQLNGDGKTKKEKAEGDEV